MSLGTLEEEQAVQVKNGGFVEMDGDVFLKIDDVDKMAPFLMNVVSSTDHWMFIGSNGALTAGRKNADNALFPYYTQDKLFELAKTTGSVSKLWVSKASWQGERYWEPFCEESASYKRHCRLYKNVAGTRVVFEEENLDLEMGYRYEWSFSKKFGFVRRSTLFNTGAEKAEVRVLDGIQNLVPYGLDQAFMNHYSNLADAYKKNELLEDVGLAIFYLSSIPTDRAEPSEGLKATIAWSPDADADAVLLSSRQLEGFSKGAAVRTETDLRAQRGAYLLQLNRSLAAGAEASWTVVADINCDAGKVVELRKRLAEGDSLLAELSAEIAENRDGVWCKVASADGLQLTGDPLRDARHFSNTMFNVMRGGIFVNGYQLDLQDFARYLKAMNRPLADAYAKAIKELGASVSRERLLAWVESQGSADLSRLAREYLPLTFSRRHGDPSRPWNKFSIETLDEQGRPVLAYQGNWRDIFQNWEPLGYSYPGYIEGMISRFLNASTADGYNPYRVSNTGFDWETIDPDEAWSNIGYWGDHQLAYLLKLLEAMDRFQPGLLDARLAEKEFVYAHVPYRIRSFEQILADPRNSVDYDDAASDRLLESASRMGADGKLLVDQDGTVVRACLLEKLLAPLLAKLSNFVPDGGIWMNTQRPEWNDANNALVGYGISVVTLCYTNRYLAFLKRLVDRMPEGSSFAFDGAFAAFLEKQAAAFHSYEGSLDASFSPESRFEMLRELGLSGEAYREQVYAQKLGGGSRTVSKNELSSYLELALRFVGKSVRSNRREDGLFHSYNLLNVQGGTASIDRLQVMLEGQVAALSSGTLSATDAAELVEALRTSSLYREDVDSFMLYPDRDLPRFLQKNVISAEQAARIPFLMRMLDRGDNRILYRDADGQLRFNGAFRNSGDLIEMGRVVCKEYGLEGDCMSLQGVVGLFETVFDHRRFTGRSGTFFAYEGLGSVYWHMVSKLVLAIQENCLWFASESDAASEALRNGYFETLAGLGLERTPQDYGAFPTDAYSHTPAYARAQQPGMTGQVKEDVLVRWSELGLCVEGGVIALKPELLRRSQFLAAAQAFELLDVSGKRRSIKLAAGQLALSLCQTPIVLTLGEKRRTRVMFADGRDREAEGWALSREDSGSVFGRDGRVLQIEFEIPSSDLA